MRREPALPAAAAMDAAPPVFLRAHSADDGTLRALARLRRDLGRDRVFVLYDATKEQWRPERWPDGTVARAWRDVAACGPGATLPRADALVFSDADCLAMNPMHDRGYGHVDVVSWSFWHAETCVVMCKDFLDTMAVPLERFWLIEYDVRCHGSMKEALARCDSAGAECATADFLANGGGEEGRHALREHAQDPGWCWFPHIVGRLAEAAPLERRLGAFFPMVRVSRALVRAAAQEFGRSTGFCEVYLPTLCRAAGLHAAAMPAELFGVFRYRPEIPEQEFERLEAAAAAPPTGLLYHPVK